MLRAIADDRGRIVARHVPSLTVDGLWCDFIATNELVGGGLVEPAWPAPVGTAAPAVLTPSGAATLAVLRLPQEGSRADFGDEAVAEERILRRRWRPNAIVTTRSRRGDACRSHHPSQRSARVDGPVHTNHDRAVPGHARSSVVPPE
jgi:hypothetical protein